MRRALAIIAVLLFSLPVQAEPKIEAGGMYSPKVMADRILGQKRPESHCDFPGLNGSLAKYAFEASIKCEIACEGKADPVATTFTGTFNPEEQGLMPGDGHHPPSFITPSSLGSIFAAWAERECLNQAERNCSDLGQIKHSRFISASSGDWTMEEAPSCSSKKILRSPYDSRLKLAHKAQTGLILPSRSSQPQPLAPGTHQEPLNCSIRITGKSCFGDCVLPESETEGEIPLTLMTDHPYATEEKSICADDLVKSFSRKNPSEAAARVLCREYFARRLLYTKSMGTSCAAFRFDADCSQVIKALTRAK